MNNPVNLVERLQQSAEAFPEAIPLIYLADGETDEQPLSYHAFDQAARRVAAALQQKELEGQRILLLFPQGLEYLIALFGCFYAGVIAVPAYPPRNNRNLLRLNAIIANCGAEFILTDQSTADHMERLKQDFSAFSFLVYETLSAKAEAWQPREVKGDDIAYLQYTSGSTGDPKGVVITHTNIVENTKALKETYAPYEVDTMVSWIPMYHDMGLMSILTALSLGKEGAIYFMSPVHFVQKPARWLQAISRYKAQYSVAPNFAFDLCCTKIPEADREGLDLSSLVCVTNGSERVRLSTMLNFHRTFAAHGFSFDAFCPGYGMAEATLGVSLTSAGEPVSIAAKEEKQPKRLRIGQDINGIEDPESYWVGCGHVVNGAEVRIVDPETRSAVPDGREGEVWVHHEGFIAKRYWNHPEASKATFDNYLDAEPGRRYLATGDLGFLLEGQLFITGRIKDMIIIRGRNYYPEDIELAVANAHEALEQNACAAFSLEVDGAEQLAIVQEVERTNWRQANPDEVVAAVRQAVSDSFEIQPYRMVFIRPISLPKTSSGKVQRRASREQLLAGDLRVMHEWTGSTIVSSAEEEVTTTHLEHITQERILAWLRTKIAEKAKMPLSEIDPAVAVQDFPLESIDAIFLSDELADWLGLKLTPDTFWAFGSLEELSEFLFEKHQEEQND